MSLVLWSLRDSGGGLLIALSFNSLIPQPSDPRCMLHLDGFCVYLFIYLFIHLTQWYGAESGSALFIRIFKFVFMKFSIGIIGNFRE